MTNRWRSIGAFVLTIFLLSYLAVTLAPSSLEKRSKFIRSLTKDDTTAQTEASLPFTLRQIREFVDSGNAGEPEEPEPHPDQKSNATEDSAPLNETSQIGISADNGVTDAFSALSLTSQELAVQEAYDRAEAAGFEQYFRLLTQSSLPLPSWKPGRAAPIVCDGLEYYSGYFSIPRENIIVAPHVKKQDWAIVIPGRKETYVFRQEEKYREDLERSRFAITRRRYGFETNRNLEILAAGAIPYFCGIERLPRVGTLKNLPLQLMRMVTKWPGVSVSCNPPKKAVGHAIDVKRFNGTAYNIVVEKMLNYTRTFMNTAYQSMYILSATSLKTLPKSVLVLWASHYTILLTGVIHGLRELGVRVEDVPRRAEVYKGPGCEEARAQTYAKGWFFFCKASESKGLSRKNISTRILSKEFDVVIISITDTLTYYMKDPFQQVPYYKEILESYPRDRIVVLNDADLIRPMQADVAHKLMAKRTLYFKRETHGCHERIW